METLIKKIQSQIIICENSIKARKAINQNKLQIIAYLNVLEMINQLENK
jgi:hypothetical protein